jgi:hypothetical protein
MKCWSNYMAAARVEVEMRRILLAGSRHVTAAETLLAPVISTWAHDWCVAGKEPTRCRFRPANTDNSAAVEPLLIGQCGAGEVSLAMTAGNWRRLLFGPVLVHVPDDEMAARIGDAAQHALLDQVFAAFGQSWSRNDASGMRADGAICLEVEINNVPLRLLVEATLLEAQVARERPPATSVSLSARAAALGAESVEIGIEIPLLNVAVEEFIGLKPGDVIRSEARLDTAFSVRIGEQVLPIKAALGMQDNRKAIRLDA